MDRVCSRIFNIAYVSVFFMYFKIIPISVETQPIIIMLLIPVSIILTIHKKMIFEKKDLLLILHLFIVVIYFIVGLIGNDSFYDSFMMFIKLIMGPLAYLTVLKNVKYIKEKNVKLVISIFAILAIIQITKLPGLNNILNILYSTFFNRFSDYTLGANSVRGLCVLVTEPSYFFYFEFLLLYSIDYLKYKNGHFENEFIFKIIIIIIACLSKSAIVYLFTIIYILQNISLKKVIRLLKKYISGNEMILSLIFLIAIIAYIILNIFNFGMLENTRFFEVMNSFTNIKLSTITDVLFYADDSSGFRFLTNAVGYLSILIYPMGGGLMSVRNNFISIANSFGIDALKNDVIRYSENNVVEIAAYVPTLVSILGFFSIIFIIYIFLMRKKSNKRLSRNMFFTLFIFLFLIQSNIFNPAFWIIIGFINSINKETNYEG